MFLIFAGLVSIKVHCEHKNFHIELEIIIKFWKSSRQHYRMQGMKIEFEWIQKTQLVWDDMEETLKQHHELSSSRIDMKPFAKDSEEYNLLFFAPPRFKLYKLIFYKNDHLQLSF
jgi:hypothetical protein